MDAPLLIARFAVGSPRSRLAVMEQVHPNRAATMFFAAALAHRPIRDHDQSTTGCLHLAWRRGRGNWGVGGCGLQEGLPTIITITSAGGGIRVIKQVNALLTTTILLTSAFLRQIIWKQPDCKLLLLGFLLGHRTQRPLTGANRSGGINLLVAAWLG